MRSAQNVTERIHSLKQTTERMKHLRSSASHLFSTRGSFEALRPSDLQSQIQESEDVHSSSTNAATRSAHCQRQLLTRKTSMRSLCSMTSGKLAKRGLWIGSENRKYSIKADTWLLWAFSDSVCKCQNVTLKRGLYCSDRKDIFDGYWPELVPTCGLRVDGVADESVREGLAVEGQVLDVRRTAHQYVRQRAAKHTTKHCVKTHHRMTADLTLTCSFTPLNKMQNTSGGVRYKRRNWLEQVLLVAGGRRDAEGEARLFVARHETAKTTRRHCGEGNKLMFGFPRPSADSERRKMCDKNVAFFDPEWSHVFHLLIGGASCMKLTCNKKVFLQADTEKNSVHKPDSICMLEKWISWIPLEVSRETKVPHKFEGSSPSVRVTNLAPGEWHCKVFSSWCKIKICRYSPCTWLRKELPLLENWSYQTFTFSLFVKPTPQNNSNRKQWIASTKFWKQSPTKHDWHQTTTVWEIYRQNFLEITQTKTNRKLTRHLRTGENVQSHLRRQNSKLWSRLLSRLKTQRCKQTWLCWQRKQFRKNCCTWREIESGHGNLHW